MLALSIICGTLPADVREDRDYEGLRILSPTELLILTNAATVGTSLVKRSDSDECVLYEPELDLVRLERADHNRLPAVPIRSGCFGRPARRNISTHSGSHTSNYTLYSTGAVGLPPAANALTTSPSAISRIFLPATLAIPNSLQREAMKLTSVILFASVAGKSLATPKFGGVNVNVY